MICKHGTLTRMHQGVALGQRRKSNSLSNPNDEAYKDEQYMQRIAEYVQKLVTTKFFLEGNPLEDNILSEKAVKKIHEAGICELHETHRRTNKVQCQRCQSHAEAGFQVCPCGGQLNMSEEMLSSFRQKNKQLIADAYVTFHGTRGASHCAQPWRKHHFPAKEFIRKNGNKGISSSILDEVFHASQLHHNWAKEWCEYLDYIRAIDISHKASPEQWERYATLYHFRYDPKELERGPIKSRPDYHQTTRAIVSMNKEAG